MSKRIPLTHGKYAIVDDADYEWLSEWKWHFHISAYTQYDEKKERERYGYARRKAMGKGIYMHRIIAHAPKNAHVDHINGDRLDNRRENLRLASRAENMANAKKYKNNTSGYIGVCQYGSRWRAQLYSQGERHYGGLYDTPEEAARAYDQLAKKIHGEFATLNFPKE